MLRNVQWTITAVAVHLEHLAHAVDPDGEVVVAGGRHVVGAIGRTNGKEMTELGGVAAGQRSAVDQLRAVAEHDAATLAFQRLVVIVTEQRRR